MIIFTGYRELNKRPPFDKTMDEFLEWVSSMGKAKKHDIMVVGDRVTSNKRGEQVVSVWSGPGGWVEL